MVSTLDRWYTIADKYLLRFSSIDTVVVWCVVCAVRGCELFVYYYLLLLLLFSFICNVGNVCKK